MKLSGLVHNSYIQHLWAIYSFPGSVCLFGADRSWENINRSQIQYMNMEIWRQNIINLFWKYWGLTVSFLGIHKLEPDIYTGFSPALHLQCINYKMPIYNYSTVKWALLAPDTKAVGGVKLSKEELAGGLSHRVHLQQGGGRQQHLQVLQCID